MKGSFVGNFYNSLDDLATELAEILVQYPDSLPDEICALNEEADQVKVQEYISELLSDGKIQEIQVMLVGADQQEEADTCAAPEELSELP